MRFTANRKALLEAVERANATAPSRSTMPIMEYLRVTVPPGIEEEQVNLRIVGADLETFSIAECPVEYGGMGSVLVPGKRFAQLLKKISAATVTIHNPIIIPADDDPPDAPVKYSTKVVVSPVGSNATYSIIGENPGEYPEVPDVRAAFTVDLDAELLDTFSKALPFVSDDILRPAMTGLYLENNYQCIKVTTTDGHRLYHNELPERSWFPFERIIPAYATSLAVKWKAHRMSFDENRVIYYCNGVTLIGRMIDETYPQYTSVIPDVAELKGTVTLPRAQAQQALERILPFVSKTTKQVILTISETELRIAGEDSEAGWECEEVIPVCYTTEAEPDDFVIGFNATYLHNVISKLTGETIHMRLWSPTRAVLLFTRDPEILLVMPVRLNDFTNKPAPESEAHDIQENQVVDREALADAVDTGNVALAHCPNCDKIVEEEDAECWYCNNDLPNFCPECKSVVNNNPAWGVCGECGYQLHTNNEPEEELPECYECGTDVPHDATVCPECGAEFAEVEEEEE